MPDILENQIIAASPVPMNCPVCRRSLRGLDVARCPDCLTGIMHPLAWCTACDGAGSIPEFVTDFATGESYAVATTCEACAGTGQTQEES